MDPRVRHPLFLPLSSIRSLSQSPLLSFSDPTLATALPSRLSSLPAAAPSSSPPSGRSCSSRARPAVLAHGGAAARPAGGPSLRRSCSSCTRQRRPVSELELVRRNNTSEREIGGLTSGSIVTWRLCH